LAPVEWGDAPANGGLSLAASFMDDALPEPPGAKPEPKKGEGDKPPQAQAGEDADAAPAA
ncbi:MAG TPA: hypothetical protein VFH78_15730, partial [Candidatus Thermoplasmatota archaeon]|nr:hypothetical protein [Candidatus Thermoplasmatota archaeon]